MGIREDKKVIQEIANKLKEARIKKSLTQAQLAKKAGMDSNAYAKLERGESSPRAVTIAKIIKALGVKSSEILGD